MPDNDAIAGVSGFPEPVKVQIRSFEEKVLNRPMTHDEVSGIGLYLINNPGASVSDAFYGMIEFHKS